jgi:hypothetical protein
VVEPAQPGHPRQRIREYEATGDVGPRRRYGDR